MIDGAIGDAPKTQRAVPPPRRWPLWLVVVAVSFVVAACPIDDTVTTEDEPLTGTSQVYELLAPADPDQAFNIVFIPDDAYGDMSVLANRQTFVSDVANLIEQGFWQNQAYFHGLFHFNYYYMTVSGNITENPDDPKGNFVCPTLTFPSAVYSQAAFADSQVIIHPDDIRNCGGGGQTAFEPTSFQTATHEHGHVLFVLPDGYCCDGGYFVAPPVMYASKSACESDPDNAAWRNCQSITSSKDGSVWWRSEGSITTRSLMTQGCCQTDVWEVGPGGWVIMDNAYKALGGITVAPPTVTPPTDWTYNVPGSP